MVTIRQLSVTDVLADGYQMAVWGYPTGDTRRAALSTLAAYLGTEGNVTQSKLTMQTARMLGRTTADEGAIEEITVGDGLSLTAGNLSADVESVNGETGTVVLTPENITDTYVYATVPADVEALAVNVSIGSTPSFDGTVPLLSIDDTGRVGIRSAYPVSELGTGATIALRDAGGRLSVATPTGISDATRKDYVDNLIDSRLSAAQRSAINALTAGVSSSDDIINALKAV